MTKKEQIAIMGGRRNWANVKNISDDATAISLYQSVPLAVMERVLYGSLMSKKNGKGILGGTPKCV